MLKYTRRHRIFGKLLDCIFPRTCFFCGIGLSFLSPEENCCRYICDDCLGDIDFITDYYCPRCGLPYEEEYFSNKVCKNCAHEKFFFRRARSIFVYDGFGRRLVHELKYHGGIYLLPDLCRFFAHMRLNIRDRILVPVPLHWFRRWKRGFNQSELLADVVSQVYGCEVVNLLQRAIHTRTQVGLSAEIRRKNVAKAFTVREDLLEQRKFDPETPFLLIDDVMTTGATLNACAQVLQSQGFRNIEVLTLARN